MLTINELLALPDAALNAKAAEASGWTDVYQRRGKGGYGFWGRMPKPGGCGVYQTFGQVPNYCADRDALPELLAAVEKARGEYLLERALLDASKKERRGKPLSLFYLTAEPRLLCACAVYVLQEEEGNDHARPETC